MLYPNFPKIANLPPTYLTNISIKYPLSSNNYMVESSWLFSTSPFEQQSSTLQHLHQSCWVSNPLATFTTPLLLLLVRKTKKNTKTLKTTKKIFELINFWSLYDFIKLYDDIIWWLYLYFIYMYWGRNHILENKSFVIFVYFNHIRLLD